MITKQNIESLLDSLGFIQNDKVYTKTIGDITIGVDCAKQEIIYPTQITIHDKTTSNFSHPENFVVFECVHRLLQKGYKPEHLELEPRWNLGREAKGGKADILVRDHQGSPYLLIECKTTDSKNSEFAKEWAKMLENGGQLFSYFQQERGVKYLCLYTSDFIDDTLKYQNYIIQAFDNQEYLNEKELEKSYTKATNNLELFSVWKESYEFHHEKQGIFENNINAYKILQTTPTFENLKELKEEGKYHEFAKILRKHNISGKENAFDKLVNIFLCKIYDESFYKDNLKFGYRGVMADTYASMQDRLMWLYKEAMREFLGEKITFVSNEDIEKDFKKLKVKALKATMQNYIKELKFYSNNDFAFLEVHNKELFLKNTLVLKEIVELFAPYKLTQDSTNQFLGNLFELFLQKGMKQDEGQFFTPMQICEFIVYSLPLDSMLSTKPLKVIDYACGAGHFLNTYANELKRYINTQDLKEHYKNIYGIEKEYRLSKVSKVSSAMYGQNEINILYADALSSFELANTRVLEGQKPKPQIQSHSFDLLIANPPYSVKGFLETLSPKSRKTYELFNTDINIESNNSIECFFIERAKQILKDNAKAAIILPSSILNKDSIYKSTREILFQNFDFIAIAELGSQTFGATGTNTIILFLRKKETFRQEESVVSQDYSLIKERLESENLRDNDDFYQNYLSAYCDFREFNKEHFLSFLEGNLNDEILKLDTFKEYLHAFKQTSEYKKLTESKTYRDSKNEDKISLERTHFIAYAQKIEKDKLLYFSLSLNQEVLIIKAPSDIKEQKRFLGYEWSNRKGDEGLKELSNPYESPLFERDNPHNDFKLNTLIRKSFDNTLDSIPQELQPYATKARLIDMIDFSKVEFNKAISLNPHSNDSHSVQSNPFANSKYELVKVGNVCQIGRGRVISHKYINDNIGEYPVYSSQTTNEGIMGKINTYDFEGEYITWTTDGIYAGTCFYRNGKFNCTNVCGTLKIIDTSKIQYKYMVQVLNLATPQYVIKVANPKLMNNRMAEVKIPLPPLEIQTQIVTECEGLESRCNTIEQSIKAYQELIKAILWHCGITTESTKDFDSILMSLAELESKLDFELLGKTKQDSKAFLQNLTNTLNTLPTPPSNGWEKAKLCKICNINQETYNPSNDEGEMLYIDIDSIEKGTGKINFNDKISCRKLPTRARRMARADSVIISTVRPYLKGFAYLKNEIKDSIFSTGFAILQGKENLVKSQFVYYCFMFSDDLMQQMKIKMPKSSYPSINTEDLESFAIPLPPLEIQTKITQSIETIQSQISFLDSALPLLQSQKQEVLKKYLF
ncbi:restriction endonuclease subunit S [Helicobacter colisuis]|uniref:restriction endonuclease subunit S n=1 Tax=Helicobacter colisuis TaxID=2949739 RepID=UPI00202A4E0C|nr:restriction endonuclease subunit S [Helicobacter colisuis]MCL9822163.1 restriction endonuclease subunit S [Helicobacter colisuis]